jgi:hypothetical protein
VAKIVIFSYAHFWVNKSLSMMCGRRAATSEAASEAASTEMLTKY